MNSINTNIPVHLNFQTQLKEHAHHFFKKPGVVKLFTYLPSCIFGKNKNLATLITRCHKVFADTKKHLDPTIKVYGGDKLHTLENWQNRQIKPKHLPNKLYFTTADSLTAARHRRMPLIDKTEKIAIVNFANRWQAGGVAYAPYGGSQEEFLARRSNMAKKENFEEAHRQIAAIRKTEGFEEDDNFHHHIPYFGTVVASNVTFIADKDTVTEPTRFDQFDTIWTAAVDNRKNSDEARFLKKHCAGSGEEVRYEIMKNKLRAIFSSAIANNDQHLILGAYGCGCFNNDDTKVASIIKNLLDTEYKGCFKSITFSITDAKKLDTFQKVLSNE